MPHPADAAPPANLSLWDAICLIVGIIIGASIYQAPPEIFRAAGSAQAGMIAWVVGGLVSLVGALCYAELASAYSTAGGDYTYLSRAYGPKVGFFFAWGELSVIRTGGSIAFMAYVFANYADQFCPLGRHSKLIYAVGGIVLLTVVNAVGMKPGRLVQNGLTVANLVGLTSVALIGLGWWLGVIPAEWRAHAGPSVDARAAADVAAALGAGAAGPLQAAAATAGLPEGYTLSVALTMVLVFYAYGGWNEAAFIASEVKDPERNVRRALIYGTLLVTVIYLAVNLAYLAALGYRGVCDSKAVAGDLFALPFGDAGRKAISALVMISALGSVNGLLFTGMRLYGTFGADHRLFTWLAGKGARPAVAHGALFAQAAFSLLLIGVVELASEWRQVLAAVAPYFDLHLAPDFHKAGGIYQLVTCTAPVFWLFFLLTGCSLFVLRYKEPNRPRPFRVPLYPAIPLLFVGSCAFMLYRSAAYAVEQEPAEAVVVMGLLFVGVPLMAFSGRSRPAAAGSRF